jgi:hypothetical protein
MDAATAMQSSITDNDADDDDEAARFMAKKEIDWLDCEELTKMA